MWTRGLPPQSKLPKIENVADVEMNETGSGKADVNQWKQRVEKVRRERHVSLSADASPYN